MDIPLTSPIVVNQTINAVKILGDITVSHEQKTVTATIKVGLGDPAVYTIWKGSDYDAVITPLNSALAARINQMIQQGIQS